MAWASAEGFTAVSDDDFARLVLAQRFVNTPRWDASQSSWLPLPIWWDGLSMLLTSTRVEVVRQLYWVWSLFGVLGCYVAGRWLGATRLVAALGALFCAALPHAVWLSMATVPDGHAAVLGLLAVASVHSARTTVRWLGAAAACAASLGRYEAWAIAGVVAAFNGYDALRSSRSVEPVETVPRRALLGPALLALLGPCGWLIHGSISHGDAFFFVQRVADYRRDLGESLPNFVAALRGYPARLLTCEPELTLFSLSSIACRPSHARRFSRVAVAAAALMLLLVVGDLRDGAPTHHQGRPLLLLWLSMALVTAALMGAWYRDFPWRAGGITAAALATGLALRLFSPAHESFGSRESELEVGRALRQLLTQEQALIYTPHYGYLAVMAGSQQPDQLLPINCGDPRQVHLEPCEDPRSLQSYAESAGMAWWVMEASQARTLGLEIVGERPPYAWGRFTSAN